MTSRLTSKRIQKHSLVRRTRPLLLEYLEERTLLASDTLNLSAALSAAEGETLPLMRYNLRIVAPDAPFSSPDLTSVNVGQSYDLVVTVQDLRTGPLFLGVNTAYLDILYDSTKTQVQVPEVQLLRFSGIDNSTNGTFTLQFGGQTATVAYTSNAVNLAASVQSALAALSNIGSGNVSVVLETQSSTAAIFRIRFTGSFYNQDVPNITVTSQGLSGGTSPTVWVSYEGDLQLGVNPLAFTEAFRSLQTPVYFSSNLNAGNLSNQIEDVGAKRVALPDQISVEQELVRAHFQATAAGTVTFTPDFSSLTSPHETTLFNHFGALTFGEIAPAQAKSLAITAANQGDIRNTFAFHNSFNEFDVTDDGYVAPDDALSIINDINAFGSRPLPPVANPPAAYPDVSDDAYLAPADALAIINVLNAGLLPFIALTERSGLIQEETRVVSLRAIQQGSRTISFDVATRFDESDATTAVEDHLLVYIVDPANHNHTLLDRGEPGTNVFSLIGSRPDFAPGIVRFDGKTVEIETNSLSVPSVAVKFQLINSDADLHSKVVARSLAVTMHAEVIASVQSLNSSTSIAPGPTLSTSALVGTSSIDVDLSNIRFNESDSTYKAELRAAATTTGIGRTVVVSFPGLPAGVTLLNASGVAANGVPYLNLTPAIPTGGLQPGNRSTPVEMRFVNPSRVPLALHPQILVGPSNRAPQFNSLGTHTVFPGGILDIPLTATDADGDRITFSLHTTQTLPNVTLRADGHLVARPAPNQLGTYTFQVVATDGVSQTSQDVTIQVVADPNTTTRVSGTVLQTTGQPLVGVTVQVGAVQGLTDQNGSFQLNLGTGQSISDTIKIRGELIAGTIKFPFIAEKFALVLEHEPYVGVNNVIARPIYLPALDTTNGKPIDPTLPITVTTAAIPGAALTINAGALLTQQGTPFSTAQCRQQQPNGNCTVSITRVPPELTPVAIPDYLRPDLVVTIQPGDMIFAPMDGVPLTLPNEAGYATGTMMDLWSINPHTGQFSIVAQGKVSANGSLIETVPGTGGIHFSSWHFFSPNGPTGIDPKTNPNNYAPQCNECTATKETNSEVELFTGALQEEHSLTGYQSLGVSRGITLHYDSLRADPRPILHFGYSDAASTFPDLQLIAQLLIQGSGFSVQVPGAGANEPNLSRDENVWNIPETTNQSPVHAALQPDLRSVPSGFLSYKLQTRISRSLSPGFNIGMTEWSGDVIHVNTTTSPFGSGWGIAGLEEIIIGPNGSALLVNGDGSELVFQGAANGSFVSPPGDFSTLVRMPDNSYRRTHTDKTVSLYDSSGKLTSVTSRVGNITTFQYEASGRLSQIVDPVGLLTTFTYSAGELLITNPAGPTRLSLDASGNLTGITDPDGSTRRWDYDATHHMIGETDKRGLREQTFYDYSGRVVRSIRKDGTTIQLEPVQRRFLLPPTDTIHRTTAANVHDAPAATSVVTEENGWVVQTLLDQAGQMQSERDNSGHLSAVQRNSLNLVQLSTDEREFATTYEYDTRGNLTKISEPFPLDADSPVFVSDFDNGLYRIDVHSGELTPVGTFAPYINDLAASATTLYGIDEDGAVFTINTGNAQTTKLLDTGIIDPDAFALAPDGTLYAANDKLYAIIPATRQVLLKGSLSGFHAKDLVFNTSGQAFVATNDNRIAEVDVARGTATAIGVLGCGFACGESEVEGLAFGSDRQLYVFGKRSAVYKFDTETRTTSFVAEYQGSPFDRILGAASALPIAFTLVRLFEYDPTFNQLNKFTDERGNVTTFDIDPANGNTIAIHEPLGRNTIMTYTARGQLDVLTDPRGDVTDYDYDALGRLVKVTAAKLTADEAVLSYEYNTAGDMLASVDGEGNRTTFEYDALHRLRKLTQPDPDGPQPSPVTQYFYDAAGNLKETIDANGQTTKMEYDGLRRLTRRTDPDPDGAGSRIAPVTTFTYDSVGNLISTVDPLGKKTSYKYDVRKWLIETVDPDGGKTQFKYDPSGNLLQLTDPVGNDTNYTYDRRNRVTSETDPLRTTIQYAYDGANNLVKKTDRNGRVTDYVFDAANRLSSETWVGGNNVVNYTYDAESNVTLVADNFSRLGYIYDTRHRVKTVDNQGTPNAPRVIVTYAYDDVGNVLSVIDTINGAAGATTAYAYDELNRLTKETQTGAGLANKRVDFSYNSLGQYDHIRRFSNLAATQSVIDTGYTYDEMNRLERLTHRNAVNGQVAFYDLDYDLASRITSTNDVDGLTSYSYDDRNQLTGADRDSGDARGDESYTYDANGNRKQAQGKTYDTRTGNRLYSDGTYSYQYDAEGNTIRRTEIATNKYRELQWDFRNRLTAVTDKLANGTATQVVRFTYDAIDRRISKSVDITPAIADAVLTHFVYDREDVILDFIDDDGATLPHSPVLSQRYLHGPGIDQVLAQDNGQGQVSWLLTDHLGTVRDLVNNSGGMANHIQYDSYGNLKSQSSTQFSSRYAFTGREFDSEASSTHYRARSYDAATGRFLSEDAQGARPKEYNVFRYVTNSPANAIDPFGFDGVFVGNRPFRIPYTPIYGSHSFIAVVENGETFVFSGYADPQVDREAFLAPDAWRMNIPAPAGMSESEWIDRVIAAGGRQVDTTFETDENGKRVLNNNVFGDFSGNKNAVNCHSITKRIIEDAGGVLPYIDPFGLDTFPRRPDVYTPPVTGFRPSPWRKPWEM